MRARLAAAAGLAAAGWALLVPLVAARAASPYSHVSQFISELGASGAPHGSLVSAAGFAPIGVLVLAFLGLARPFFPPSRRATAGLVCFAAVGAGYLAAAAFPCDAGCPSAGSRSQALHNRFGLLEYAGAVAGLLLLGASLRACAAWRSAARACFAAAGVVALGFLAMLVPELASARGLSQRVAESAIFLWIAAVGVRLLRRGGSLGPAPERRGAKEPA